MTRQTEDAYGSRMRPNILGGRMPALSPRLRRIADWVPQGARLADVGTDHAYLPVWLRQQGRIPFAIASDLRPGPLQRAKHTGEICKVKGIDYRLSNGLLEIRPEEVDVIVIAGMGSETICSILESASWTSDGRHLLLMQPQSYSHRLRRYLTENGYLIRRECLVEDRGKLYPILEASAGKEALSLGQLWGGAKLLSDPLGDRYLIERIIRLQQALEGQKSSCVDSRQAEETRQIITALLGQREEWRHVNSQAN